ncbi:MAG: MBL fold metallo-hydrolase [Candidatus Korarchaeum sp.]
MPMWEVLMGSPTARVTRVCCGPFESLCYLLEDRFSGSSFLIDAGCPAEEVVRLLEERGSRLEAVLLTHTHFDHLLEVNSITRSTGSKALAHPKDVEMLPVYWREDLGNIPEVIPSLEEGLTLSAANLSLVVLHTPGHTPGSVCYYSRDLGVVFTGDTLFKGAIGTLRYSGSPDSYGQMRRSLRKLSSLPRDTVVLPGHGDRTTIREERDMMRRF